MKLGRSAHAATEGIAAGHEPSYQTPRPDIAQREDFSFQFFKLGIVVLCGHAIFLDFL
jgi:hypothetical protein